MKKFYSVKEAAELLNVSTNTVYTYLKENKLYARRFGRGRFKIPFLSLAPFISVSNEKEIVTEDNPVVNKGRASLSKQGNLGINLDKINDLSYKSSIEEAGYLQNWKDIVFFRLYKFFCCLGVGFIYLTIEPLKILSTSFLGKEIDGVILPILPFVLILSGIISLLTVFYEEKLEKFRLSTHVLNVFVFIIFSFYLIYSGNYLALMFSVPLLFITLNHIFSGVFGLEEGGFFSRFTKYLALIIITLGVIIFFVPESLFSGYILDLFNLNKGLYIMLWYVLLLPILFYLLYKKNIPSISLGFFYFFVFVVLFLLSSLLGYKSFWVSSYLCLITSIFVLFLVFWHFYYSKDLLSKRKIYVFTAIFFWISVSCLFGIFTLWVKKKSDDRQIKNITDSYVERFSDDLISYFERQGSLLVGISGDVKIKKAILANDTNYLNNEARKLYEEGNNLRAVIFYDENGKSISVYPLRSIALNTNFSEREYFQKTKIYSKGYVSNVYLNILGNYTIMQTEPIFDENRFVGMIGFSISLPKLSEKYTKELLSNFNYWVLDKNKVVTLSNNEDLIGSNLEKNDKKYGINQNQERISSMRLISNPDWEIYIESDSNHFAGNFNLVLILNLVLVINGVLAMGIGFIFSFRKMPNLMDLDILRA